MPDAMREGSQPFVLGPDDGEATWFLGTRMTVKATAQTTGGAFGLIEVRLAVGFSPPLPSTTGATHRSGSSTAS